MFTSITRVRGRLRSPGPNSGRNRVSLLLTAVVLVLGCLAAAAPYGDPATASVPVTSAKTTAAGVGQAKGSTWVGGWQAALTKGGRSFTDQTVRMVLHTTVGGSRIRVRLSDAYGTRPLDVGAVDVAVQASGGDAVPGSHHAATFSGRRTTTVPVGAETATDPIDMTVKPEENLLVSVYYPDATGPSSWHSVATENTYVSGRGDFAADDTTANYPASDTSWYFVDGLDALSPTAHGTLVAFGASIVDGFNSTVSANDRWPNVLARRLQARPGGPALGVVDAGIAGNQVLTDTGTEFGTSALHRFAHDALGEPGVRAVILLEGTNDIGNDVGPHGRLTPQDLIHGYQALIGRAHAAGVKVYGAPLTPYQGAAYYTRHGEVIRQVVNRWMRTSGAFDGVIDFNAAIRDPSDPHQLDPVLDSGDHLHPNDAGYRAMADAVDVGPFTG